MKTQSHTVLITGAGSGIGLALAKKFHAAGNQLILVGRRAAALQSAAEQLPGACIYPADIRESEQRTALLQRHPHISILVNNAAIQRNSPLRDQSAADIRDELETNLLAPILLTHAYLPHLMQQSEAAIINITSGLALVPKASASIYCASKAGLHSFSQSLRWQLTGSDVKVFEILPPLVDTAMTAGRGKGKISPDALADRFWHAFTHNRYHIPIGKTRVLSVIQRLSPALAARIMRNA